MHIRRTLVKLPDNGVQSRFRSAAALIKAINNVPQLKDAPDVLLFPAARRIAQQLEAVPVEAFARSPIIQAVLYICVLYVRDDPERENRRCAILHRCPPDQTYV